MNKYDLQPQPYLDAFRDLHLGPTFHSRGDRVPEKRADAKVTQLHFALAVEEDVAGFDVPARTFEAKVAEVIESVSQVECGCAKTAARGNSSGSIPMNLHVAMKVVEAV